MAVSAYKGEQLKKNPLLGTALKSDIDRGQERESFKRLYGEAVSSGARGRSHMEGKLAGRYARATQSTQRALGTLGTQYSSLQSEANRLRTGDVEKRSELAERVRKAKREKGKAEKDRKIQKRYLLDYYRSPEWRNLPSQEKWKLAKNPKSLVSKHYATKLAEAEEAERAYQTGITSKAKDLEQRGMTIEAEMDRRRTALQQRIADYNLFLGQA